MTLESQLTKVHYYDGTELRLPFPVLRSEHVRLILADLATGKEDPVESGYTVTGCGTNSVDVHYEIPAGKKLTIYRELPLIQEMDLENGTAFDGEVIETNFDILAMQVQQVAEEVERAFKVSITSDMDTGQFLEEILAAHDAADEAIKQADKAEQAASESAVLAEAAARSAEEAKQAAEDTAQRAPNATEEAKGIVRLATIEEHETGALNLAAQPGHVKSLVEENIRQHAGLPLLSPIWLPTTAPQPGLIRCDADTGQLADEAWPEAAAEIRRRHEAGDVYCVTEEEYQADLARSEGRVTLRFSIGDGATWFRLPILGGGIAPSSPWPEKGLMVGKFTEDKMRPITGEVEPHNIMGLLARGFGENFSGAFKAGRPEPYSAVFSNSINGSALAFDSSLLGVNYNGYITHGPRGVLIPYIKMYGTASEASEANMAALVAGLPGKVDTERFAVSQQVLHVRDEKPSGTAGGTFTSGAWRTRDMNTVKTNTIPGASLADNQVVLPIGEYLVTAWAVANMVANHRVRLCDQNTGVSILVGSSSHANANLFNTSIASVSGKIALSSNATIELQHRCSSSAANNGFGIPASFDDPEVYSEIVFTRLA